MVRISGSRLDYLIAEDVPYIDLTSSVLGIDEAPGEMEYYTREPCVVAGTRVVRGIAERLGCEVLEGARDGDALGAQGVLLRVRGSAGCLHRLWKVGLNVFDHLSAVATKTRAMVDAVHAVAPECGVLTTRKSMPGVKDLLVAATVAGGAWPHRLGLSETVLVFGEHIEFLGGFEAFLEQLPSIRRRCVEKKLFVEATPEQAPVLAGAGVDGLQLDKVAPDDLNPLVGKLRAADPRLTIIAAGGIGPHNAADYAACGVDGIATTAPFSAKPLDMSVRMKAREYEGGTGRCR